MILEPYIKEFQENISLILKQDLHKAFLVTVSFSSPLYLRDTDPRIIPSQIKFMFTNYNSFYRHLCSRLMTNFTKKLHLHPRTFDFVDFPHTRHSRAVSLIEPKTPHFHSVYLVHRDTLDRFNNLMSTNFAEILSHLAQRNVITAHAKPIKPTNADLKRVLSYSMKFLADPRADALNEETPLMNQYPIHKDELKTRSNPDVRFYECNADLLAIDCRRATQKMRKLSRSDPVSDNYL